MSVTETTQEAPDVSEEAVDAACAAATEYARRWEGDPCPPRGMVRRMLAAAARVSKPVTLPPPGYGGMRDLTCGACGLEFGTNFAEDEIECAECEARRCPCCGEWFGRQEW